MHERITSVGYVVTTEAINHTKSECSKFSQKEYKIEGQKKIIGTNYIKKISFIVKSSIIPK